MSSPPSAAAVAVAPSPMCRSPSRSDAAPSDAAADGSGDEGPLITGSEPSSHGRETLTTTKPPPDRRTGQVVKDSAAFSSASKESSSAPPLPGEAEDLPAPSDDGWECLWEAGAQTWYFFNRFTGVSQWENPRVPDAAGDDDCPAPPSTAAEPRPPVDEKLPAGGYNPAIHGDYDPKAWYAQAYNQDNELPALATAVATDPASASYDATAAFNRFTGQFQTGEAGPSRHSDDAKSRRQMNAFFDVDAAANAHDGRSLKAERANKRISKTELKAFKEKRRAKKEEKRRAWLMD